MPKKTSAKLKKKKAAEILQRYGRGWLARYFYRQFKHIVKLRELPAESLLHEYKLHLGEIIERHTGQNDAEITTDLREVCDYYFKLDKYEIAFDELCEDREGIPYAELLLYFEVLSLTPTRAEIRLATDKVLQSNGDEYRDVIFNKDIVVDIALHIYVPKGTHLQNTRKSTWLCPIVGNDDALRFGANSKKICMERCLKLVATSIREGKEENEEEDTAKSSSKTPVTNDTETTSAKMKKNKKDKKKKIKK